jgi:hypothetical protein
LGTEEWKVIFTDQAGPSAGNSAGTTGASSQGQSEVAENTEDIAEQGEKNSTIFAGFGKLLGGFTVISAAATTIAFVFQMIKRSRIFSTFMDAFFTTLSAFVDIMLIPLIPAFTWVIKFLVKLLPQILDFTKNFEQFMKDPFGSIKDIFDNLKNLPENIGKAINGFLSGLGLGDVGAIFGDLGKSITTMLNGIQPKFNKMIEDIQKIWGDSSLTTFEKIGKTFSEVTKTLKDSWYQDVVPAAKDFWSADIKPIILSIFGTGAGKSLTGLIDSLFEIWGNPNSSFFQKIGESFSALGTSLRQVWDNVVMPFITSTWNTFVENTLKPKWSEFVENTLKPGISNFVTDTLPRLIIQFITIGIPKIIATLVQPLINAVMDMLPFGWGKTKGKAGGGYTDWPSNAVGSSFIPKDMNIYAHKGESILPAGITRALASGNISPLMENMFPNLRQSASNKTINMYNEYNLSGDQASLPKRISSITSEDLKNTLMRIT